MPDDLLLITSRVVLNTPLEKILSRPGVKAICEICGEEVLNGREIVHEGMVLCRSCAGHGYYHGVVPAMPQIPLSLANSVYATADAARQYFGPRATHVTPRRLLTTLGLSNAAAALLGGVPVCHGCGGLTAHYRLGARTGGAPLMLGIAFLLLGLLDGATLLPLLRLVPFSALGVLLAYVGAQHSLLAQDPRGASQWLPAVAVAVTAWLTRNLALGFAAGAGVYFAIRIAQRENRSCR